MEIDSLLNSIQELEDHVVWNNVAHSHSFGRVPNEEEIRLWQIPPSTGNFLKTLIESLRPMCVLEIGTSVGYSTLWMAQALNNYGGKIDTIEIFEPKIEMAKRYFSISGFKNICLLVGDARDITKIYSKTVDFLFLDADKENYITYLKNLEKNFKRGTIVIADNVVDYRYLLEDFLKYVNDNHNYQSIILDFDHGLLLAIYLGNEHEQ